jgi:peptidoglycan/LPS O-acetylase OafA/YrhL
VDLFFMLSGFVIAHAYEDKLRAGMGFGAFAGRRLRRLWPMAVLGTVLSIAVLACPPLSGDAGGGAASLVAWGVFGALLLPNLFAPAGTVLWANGPAWSLHFELVANGLYAVQQGRWTGRFLAVLIAAAFAVLAVWAWKLGSLGEGGKLATYTLGLGRVLFAFPMGVLLHRLHREGRLPRANVSPWALVATACAVLAAPDLGRAQGAFDLFAVALVFPALVALAASCRCGPRTARVFAAVGELSYPLYCLHPPIIRTLVVGAMLLGAPPAWWAALSFPVMGITVALAWAAHRFIERPWAMRKRAPAKSTLAAATT